MSRTLKLRLHQSQALADLPVPKPFAERLNETSKPLDTGIHDGYVPPMRLREALLTDSRWVDLSAVLNAREEIRRRKELDLEEETCGALEHPMTSADYLGSGRWVDGEYIEDAV